MRDVFFAFYGEGRADYEFLLKIIVRSLKKLVPTSDFEPTPIRSIEGETQMERQSKLVEKSSGLHFIIVHHDADASSEDETLNNLFIPDYEKKRIVPIIPIKETEAWLLADFEAFKGRIGTKLSAKELGFPAQPHQVEAINEPKEVLNAAISRSRPRGRRLDLDEIYDSMGDKVSLERLEKVSAFQNFQKRIIKTLIEIGFRELEQS